MKIAIGSKNAAKLRSGRIALKKVFPGGELEIISLDAPSKVSSQPKSDLESITGAINRAKFAQESANADYGIGLEGGLSKIGKYNFECGWIAVVDKRGKVGLGSSARFEVPPIIQKMLSKGMELGDIMDKLVSKKNTKSRGGAMGILTRGKLTRTLAYSHGIIFAFVPFISKEYWE